MRAIHYLGRYRWGTFLAYSTLFIATQGTHAQLMENGPVYAEIYHAYGWTWQSLL